MIDRIDHVVLTTRDESACVRFYTEVLGMRLETFAGGRLAFAFGEQKINLHVAFAEQAPCAHLPVPGSQDWCLVASRPLADVVARLERHDVPILEGPVARAGATGPIRSVYVRDPDGNLIEIAEYVDPAPASSAR